MGADIDTSSVSSGNYEKGKITKFLEKGLKEHGTVSEFKKSTRGANGRDPNNLHEDVKINFDDIIAEPADYHSSKYTWHMAKEIYSWGKTHAYEFFSFFFGIPMSLIWSCVFAFVACLHVWCYAPMKRSHRIKMGCWSHFWSIIISSCFDPVFTSAGKTWSNIEIRTEKIIV